ncbi:MAG: hypothetical protein ACHQIO_23200 [Nevskiales bacterium]
MARMPLPLTLLLPAALLAGCGQGHPQDQLGKAVAAAWQQSEQQAAADPARRPHPDDPNPLRRKLGDLQIKELFFGPTQTQGDWMAYLPCSQDYFGQPVAGPNRIYLKRCPALEQYLLAKAKGAGFAEANTRDVLDPRISGAAQDGTRP